MADAFIELLAAAIHNHWQSGLRSWEECCTKLPGQAHDFRAKARDAIAALDAAGFVIVPKEPTEKMMRAGRPWAFRSDGKAYPAADSIAEEYRAMLAASQKN